MSTSKTETLRHQSPEGGYLSLTAEPGPLAANAEHKAWQLHLSLHIYRLIVSGTLIILCSPGVAIDFLGQKSETLYLITGITYLIWVLCGFSLIQLQKPNLSIQTLGHAIVDIIAIAIMSYASGGISSGLPLLLLPTVLGGGLWMNTKISFHLTLFAIVCIVAVETIHHWMVPMNQTELFLLSVMTLSFLISTYFVGLLAKRIHHSDVITQQQQYDIARLEHLNETIIQQMKTGVVVFNQDQKNILMNESAWLMLNMPNRNINHTLDSLMPNLAKVMAEQHQKDNKTIVFKQNITGPEMTAEITQVTTDEIKHLVIFLSDTSHVTQKVQQLKLASLGRLTASIAHEVRNPLGAISHAAQLLQESPDVTQNDTKLLEIIQKHSIRINDIIETVLQLSRRNPAYQEKILLQAWIEKFIRDYTEVKQGSYQISMNIQPETTEVLFDPNHLRQILTNLFNNGLRYSQENTGSNTLLITGGSMPESSGPFLDIIDQGAGIDPETAQSIFEPFFTTEKAGTGLGLYICKELCEINQARLDFLPIPVQGSCFRITFSKPRKVS